MTVKQARNAVDRFNRLHPVGTEVIVSGPGGADFLAKTSGPAYACRGEAMIQVDRGLLYYPFGQVRVVTPKE